MIIRRAENKDIDGLNRLLFQVCMVHHNGRPDLFACGGKKYTDDQLMEIIKDDTTPIFVAVDENDYMLGYSFCVINQYNEPHLAKIKTLYIDDLCVDENARGQHIGKQLYDYVLNFAKSIGCYNVTLNVWTCNEGAMKFYEKCGLKPQKIGMEHIL